MIQMEKMWRGSEVFIKIIFNKYQILEICIELSFFICEIILFHLLIPISIYSNKIWDSILNIQLKHFPNKN
jgi:hypothetical protein